MEIVLLIATLAALLWSVVFLRFAGLWGCLLATLLLGAVLGYEFFHVSVVTSDRLLIGGCVAAGILLRIWGVLPSKPWSRSDALLALFLVVMTLSTFAGNYRLDGYAPVSKLLFFFLLPTCFYWLARQVDITPSRLRGLFASFALLGLYLSLTSAAEKFGAEWAIYPKYIINSENQEFLGRGRGPLLNPSANGVLLTLGLSCWLMFFPQFAKLGKLIVLGGIPVFLLGIYCTLTRCVWMGGAAALGGIILLAIPKRMRAPLLAIMVISGVLVVGANYERLKSFKRDKNVSEAGMRESAELRPILAYVAWSMFLDNPIAGVGAGQYKNEAKYYLQDRSVDLPLEKVRPYVQHNIFLSVLTENGLLGLLPFVGLLCIWSGEAWKLWSREHAPLATRQMGLVFLGMMAGFLCNGMFQDVLIMQMINAYLFFLAGCVGNLAQQPANAAAPYETPRPQGCVELRSATWQRPEAVAR